MSSSKKKQLRKEQYLSERQERAAAEAKKLKRYTMTFWIVIALVACIFVGALCINPIKSVRRRNTDALTVNDHNISAVELNYFYYDGIQNYRYNAYSQYYLYIALGYMTMSDALGFKTGTALDQQTLSASLKTSLGTDANNWAEYFLEYAQNTAVGVYTMCDLAEQAGYTLSDSELAGIESTIDSMKEEATEHGYTTFNSYLTAVYGSGANQSTYREYLRKSTLASSYLSYYSDNLEFTADELIDYQKNSPYLYNCYSYGVYTISVSDFYAEDAGTKDEDGKVTYTDAETLAAVEAARKAAEQLNNGEYESIDEFLLAIGVLEKQIFPTETQADDEDDKDTTPENYTAYEDKFYSSISSTYADWVIGKQLKSDVEEKDSYDDEDYEYITRTVGETTMVSYPTTATKDNNVTAFYVVCFNGLNDNSYLTKDVYHILVSCTGTENDDGSITFSDASAAAVAQKTAEKILAEVKQNATLANMEALGEKYLADGTSAESARYKGVYLNQMVSQFEDWCYDESRAAGDAEIVATTYGYHVIYFVGDGLSYHDYLVDTALRNETVNDWYEQACDDADVKVLTTEYVRMDVSVSD